MAATDLTIGPLADLAPLMAWIADRSKETQPVPHAARQASCCMRNPISPLEVKQVTLKKVVASFPILPVADRMKG